MGGIVSLIRQYIKSHCVISLSDENTTVGLLLIVIWKCNFANPKFTFCLGREGPRTPHQTRTYGARERSPISPVFRLKHLAPSLEYTYACLCTAYHRSNNFIIGLTNTRPLPGSNVTLWDYFLCGQYPGAVLEGATVSLFCASNLPPSRYVVVQFPIIGQMNFCELQVFAFGLPFNLSICCLNCLDFLAGFTFYRAMLHRVLYCYGNSSVCLSVCLWRWSIVVT